MSPPKPSSEPRPAQQDDVAEASAPTMLTNAEATTLLTKIAANVSAAAIEAALGRPYHLLLAGLVADRRLRTAYASALDASATLIEDEVDRLTAEATEPGQPEPRAKLLMKRADLLSQTAAGRRRLAIRMSGRILPDKVKGPYQPISKRRPKTASTTPAPPTTSGPNSGYWEGKVARHLQKLDAAKPSPTPAPAAAQAPVVEPLDTSTIELMNDGQFRDLVKRTIADQRRFHASAPDVQRTFLARGRRMGIIAPAAASTPVRQLEGFCDATLDAIMEGMRASAAALKS